MYANKYKWMYVLFIFKIMNLFIFIRLLIKSVNKKNQVDPQSQKRT